MEERTRSMLTKKPSLYLPGTFVIVKGELIGFRVHQFEVHFV